MNNRNQQTARTPAPAQATALTYLNVFTVEEYERDGKIGKKWTRIGAAYILLHRLGSKWSSRFPHKGGIGFSKAFPLDGRLIVLPPDTDDNNTLSGK